MNKKNKKRLLTILCLMGVLSLSGCGKDSNVQKQLALKQEGMQLQSAGSYEEAIKKYDEALGLANMSVGDEEIDIAYYKASAQYRNGDVTGAIETYSSILALKKDVNDYLGRGLLYAAAGDRENAEADLNQALSETKDDIIRGIIYEVVEDTAAAKKCFENARDDGNAEADFYLANIYEKTGDHNYAMILYEEYLQSDVAGAEGYLTVGRYKFEEGAYDEALTMIQSGIALGDSGVYKDLLQEEVACMEKLGDFDGAKEKVNAYLELYPEDAVMLREQEFLQTR